MINSRYVKIQGRISGLEVSFEGQNAGFKENDLQQLSIPGTGRMVLTA
jgi:hypothetical protein